MDKKPLIVVSLCAVVLLVMGSLSNVVGYQINQNEQQNLVTEMNNISVPSGIDGLEIVGFSFATLSPSYDWFVVQVKNIGNETIHSIICDGYCHKVFFHRDDVQWGGPWIGHHGWKPQQICNISWYLIPAHEYNIQHFYEMKFIIRVDAPGYNVLEVEGKYRLHRSSVSPMSGNWLWLANLLGL
jgi:hypothetical protein